MIQKVKEEKEIAKIYKIHKYWSRKPWKPIADCIKTFSKEGDTVVDLFLGSGVTCLESINLNRNFIGYDLNPVAIFVSENTSNRNFDEKIFFKDFEIIKEKLNNFFTKLYSSEDSCNLCNRKMIIDHINIGPKFKGKEEGIFFCFECGKKKTIIKRNLTKKDLNRVNYQYPLTEWVPNIKFPKKFYKDRFSYKGITKITDFYTKRNLYALSKILNIISNSNLKYKQLFLVAFSNTILHASKLKSENVRPLNVNNYWMPDDFMEENAWLRFLDRINLVLESKRYLQKRFNGKDKIGKYKLYNKSSLKTHFDDKEVDYIITDPPYGDTIQYSELSLMWNAWLNTKFKIKEEIIINPVQNKGIDEYIDLLELSIKEAKRILKENGKFTLCFQNKNLDIWYKVILLFKKYGFLLEDVQVFNTLKNSYNNNWAKFSPKSDVYVTFEKVATQKITHFKRFSITELIEFEIKNNKGLDISKVYDSLVSKFIWFTYENNSNFEETNVSIKKINDLMYNLQNGNR